MIYLTPVGWAQLSALFKWVGKKWDRWFVGETASEIERLNYPEPPMLQHGVSGTPIENFQGTPFLRSEVKRAVLVPKDVWAELQAMPNDGSWSTRQLVRAIQRANKKKRGKA